MNDEWTNGGHTRSRRRLQFSVLSLFILTTATCLALTWWVWPQSAEVVALINASATPLPVSRPSADGSQQQFVVYQQKLLAALNSPTLLQDTAAITGNGKLRMLRGRSDPAAWLRKRLEIEVVNNSLVSVTLTVPEYFQKDAIEVVDYITLKCVSRTTVEVGNRTRKYLKSLRHEQRSLNREISRNTAKLQRLSRTLPGDDPQLATLEAEIRRLSEEVGELSAAISVAQGADNSSNHLQFVQMATATATGR